MSTVRKIWLLKNYNEFLDNFFQLEPVTYSIIRKNQGTPAKLLCRTFPQYEELPQMAEWFKDGRYVLCCFNI